MSDNQADDRDGLLASIKAAFEGDPQAFITQTADPRSADLLLIGTFVQLYCYADFNGRRIVDILRHAALGEPRSASRLQDTQVFPMLQKLAGEHLWDGHLKDGLLKASSTIEMHQIHRHNFAHWMVRRVKDRNALVLFSMNSKESERRDDVPLDPEDAKYCILPLDGFDAEVEKLKGHTNYLARTAAEFERTVDELRDAIAARKGK